MRLNGLSIKNLFSSFYFFFIKTKQQSICAYHCVLMTVWKEGRVFIYAFFNFLGHFFLWYPFHQVSCPIKINKFCVHIFLLSRPSFLYKQLINKLHAVTSFTLTHYPSCARKYDRICLILFLKLIHT